ncbi:cobalamin-dependent protein [Nocardioides sp. LHD-245]|uniref:cobalamin B12-binding domain-containing protein n=1 Tax=Nocardioides sp. LHD-245 TaxID=3051387 RepID=UPI0027DF6B5E|nr:cobalamin-dependent protein [Nocardioides sp. LHD-245]
MATTPKLRILLTKVGMDGHDRGIKVIARTLRDAGHEVIYMGRRQTPEGIARAAAHEDADVVGVSVLSGTHASVARSVVAALREAGLDTPVVMGGTILHREIPDLKEAGVATVFPVATKLAVIEEWFAELAEKLDDAALS